MYVAFERREELTAGIWQHYFKPERPLQFQPGQYLELVLPDVYEDPRGNRRTFTLTSLPSDPLFSFVTKDQDVVSPYKNTLSLLQTGDRATVTDPMGDLILPKDPSVPLIFIGGGIGIASYASMLKQLLATDQHRTIQLYYAVRWKSELILQDILNSYQFAAKRLIISPNRLDIANILTRAPADCLWYLSGSQRFVEDAQYGLEAHGISREYIVFDYYDGYADL